MIDTGMEQEDNQRVAELEEAIREAQLKIAKSSSLITSEALDVGRSATEETFLTIEYLEEEVMSINEAIDEIKKARVEMDNIYEAAELRRVNERIDRFSKK